MVDWPVVRVNPIRIGCWSSFKWLGLPPHCSVPTAILPEYRQIQGIPHQCQSKRMGCHKIFVREIHVVARIPREVMVNQMSKKVQPWTNVIPSFSTGDSTIRQGVQRRSVNIVGAFELAFFMYVHIYRYTYVCIYFFLVYICNYIYIFIYMGSTLPCLGHFTNAA